MRCIGRVLIPSRPVGPTTCKVIPGLALSLRSWNRSSVRPISRPVGPTTCKVNLPEASGTTTISQCEGDKLVNDRPAGDKHDTDQQQGTQDSNKLASFSPLLAYIALALKINRIPLWALRA